MKQSIHLQNISEIQKKNLFLEQFLKQMTFPKKQKVLENTYFQELLKNNTWLQYFYLKKPLNLLFSIDQFSFEFLKKAPQKKKFSEFKLQLKERKKLKIFYGFTSTKQLFKIIHQASQHPGYFSTNFLGLLERRLDVTLYRSSFTKNITQARQLIAHKKILVNNSIITIPSYTIQPGDIISIDSKTQSKLVDTLKTNCTSVLEKPSQSKVLLPEKFLENLIETKGLVSKASVSFLTKLLVKKIFHRVDIETFKNPYSSAYLAFLKSKSLVQDRKVQDRTSALVKTKQSEKYYYRQLLFTILSTLNFSNIPNELLVLKLSKFIKKIPSKRKYLTSLQFYGKKPLHLEISYKLMKIIVLYSPQRIYYPFTINIDILKRSSI